MLSRILMIDDDLDLLRLMPDVLDEENYHLTLLTGTENIIADAISHQPDLIILDYLLRGINGGELCCQLKGNLQTCNIPVLILSAYPRVLLPLGSYQCDLFIAKPFDLIEFREQIRKLTQSSDVQKLRN